MKNTFVRFGTCLLSKLFDTQVARRGRQYHCNPPPYKNRPTKKNRIYKIKRPPPPPPPNKPNQPTTTTTAQSNPTHPTPKPNPRHHIQPNPTQPTQHPNRPNTTAQPNPTQRKKKFQLAKVVKITKYQNIKTDQK